MLRSRPCNPTRTRVALLLAWVIACAPLGTSAAEPERPDPWKDHDRWEDPHDWDTPEPETPMNATDLAADCNDDGVVQVRRSVEVRGGLGTLTRDCTINIAESVHVDLFAVTLAGAYEVVFAGGTASALSLVDSYITLATRIAFAAGDRSALALSGSELSTMPDGPIQLSAGGVGGVIEIGNSMVMSAGALLLAASPSADGGRVDIREATLSSGDDAAEGIAISASLPGLNGELMVRDCRLVASSSIAIETGGGGRTTVSGNVFLTRGTPRIAAGRDGVCEARDNEPPTACSAALD